MSLANRVRSVTEEIEGLIAQIEKIGAATVTIKRDFECASNELVELFLVRDDAQRELEEAQENAPAYEQAAALTPRP